MLNKMTPRPWRIEQGRKRLYIKGPMGQPIANLPLEDLRDARLIVLAVNSFAGTTEHLEAQP